VVLAFIEIFVKEFGIPAFPAETSVKELEIPSPDTLISTGVDCAAPPPFL
jgi:hypothetical protein